MTNFFKINNIMDFRLLNRTSYLRSNIKLSICHVNLWVCILFLNFDSTEMVFSWKIFSILYLEVWGILSAFLFYILLTQLTQFLVNMSSLQWRRDAVKVMMSCCIFCFSTNPVQTHFIIIFIFLFINAIWRRQYNNELY